MVTGVSSLVLAVSGRATGGSLTGVTVTLTVAVSVELPQQEMQSPWLDEPLLRDLARLSGGEFFRLDEVDRLADAVPDRREVAVTRHPPRPVWDGW